eukprot:scaffold522_cov194-Chaetoceros_neogracile.AAC.2
MFGTPYEDFAVHSQGDDIPSTVVFLKTSKFQSEASSKYAFTKESFSIRFALGRVDISGYCHGRNSSGYYLSTKQFIIRATFSGAYAGLYKCLKFVESNLGPNAIETISLKVTAPSLTSLR